MGGLCDYMVSSLALGATSIDKIVEVLLGDEIGEGGLEF